MLILLFITFVWLKIVAGDTLVFFWLWLARDRGISGRVAFFNYCGVLLFWLAPWVALLWHELTLYAGHCGLRQGPHVCGLVEFLWSEFDWAKLGFLLDLSLFAGSIVLMMRARVATSDELPVPQPESAAP